ncbi:DUF5455 family protein [Janthinobacterium sp. SUN128]|uniref:DUF5455 family protein n=1 Tax=Janthinobacterium sp. SUN128 TaxID=3014790 RepID=UPI002712347B|nr:DUF5455 family protein [Janthinobacterium sp. SUN128]MDO8035068.1 DUF5455 family protein [Janthinobacterium sp. SUN128]
MPALAALLVNLVVGFIGFLLKYFTQKVVVAGLIVTFVVSMFYGFMSTFTGVINSAIVGAGSVHPMFGAGVAMAVPPQTASLLSAYFVFYGLCEVYKYKLALVALWSKTS